MSESAELVEQPQSNPQPVAGEDMAAGGNQFDPDKNEFVNKTPREENGRFAAVRASLEQSTQASEYKKNLLAGFVDPDESMSPDQWALARTAQIRSKAGLISAPDFGEGKSGTDAAPAEQPAAQKPLTVEEIKHNESYSGLMGSIAAKLAIDPELKSAKEGFQSAMASGAVPEQAVGYLGHVLADVDNPHDVLVTLGKNPDVLTMYAQLGPVGMKSAVVALSRELLAKNAVKPVAVKPKPPDPVGARATATDFDPNDDSLDGDEWLRLRQKQVSNRRAAGR